MKEWSELFVPGRLCLFGEHSDWAGEHRKHDSNIEKGYTLVCQTNQGAYAKIKRRDDKRLVMKSTLSEKVLDVEMQKNLLDSIAKDSNNIFSYVSGVAYYILERYDNNHVSGIEIDNYKTTLPVKKGLSSSASICVLTARAFNEAYNLKLTKEGEMDLAYKGEVLTPSRCGRMDQACAFDNPVLMTFDGNFMKSEELRIGNDLYLCIVDLKRGKNTLKILEDLNMHFFNPPSRAEVRSYLGRINKDIVILARNALERGDAELIGSNMEYAQELFDRYLMKYCDELKAPRLHEVLKYKKIKDLIYGGKGVGSQGDGCAQLICKGIEERKKAMKILEKDLGVECYELDLKRS